MSRVSIIFTYLICSFETGQAFLLTAAQVLLDADSSSLPGTCALVWRLTPHTCHGSCRPDATSTRVACTAAPWFPCFLDR